MHFRLILALSIFFLSSSLLISCSKKLRYGEEASSEAARRRCQQLYDEKDWEQANGCYEQLRARFPGTDEGVEAELRAADVLFEKKDYLLAAESYRNFAKLHPTDRRLPYVYYKAGLSYLKESPKAIDRDQEHLQDAIGFLEVGLRYFPNSNFESQTRAVYNEARTKVAKRHMYVARFYLKTKEYKGALSRLAIVSDQYRGIGLDEEALYLMAKAFIEIEKKEKAFETTAHLKQRFPNSKYLDKLSGDLGVE